MASVYSDEYQRVINALKKARKEMGLRRHNLPKRWASLSRLSRKLKTVSGGWT